MEFIIKKNLKGILLLIAAIRWFVHFHNERVNLQEFFFKILTSPFILVSVNKSKNIKSYLRIESGIDRVNLERREIKVNPWWCIEKSCQ